MTCMAMMPARQMNAINMLPKKTLTPICPRLLLLLELHRLDLGEDHAVAHLNLRSLSFGKQFRNANIPEH